MKKNIIIILVAIVVVAAAIGLIYASTILHGKETNEDNHLLELNMTELQKKVDNKETFILLISQTTCSHCMEYKPTLKKVLTEYDITGYFIELDKLNDEEKAKLYQIASANTTPQTIFIEDGEEKNTAQRLSGTTSESKLKSRLKALGYIEE